MISVELAVRKMRILKKWLFDRIDDIHWDLQEGYRKVQVDLEMEEINKIKDPEENPLIVVTDHAYSRAKERLSMSRSSFLKLSERAFLSGIKHSDTAGNLKKWIDKTWFSHKNANNVRIYGEVFFLFSGNLLITVYQVPNNLRKSALKIQDRSRT